MNFPASSDHLLRLARYIIFFHIVFFAAFFSVFIRPFDKPDEDVHFYKAVSVSRGHFICEIRYDNPYNLIPRKFYNFAEMYRGKSGVDVFSLQKLSESNTILVNETHSCVLPFFFYLLPGGVIFVLDSLHFPVSAMFFAGRIVNMIFAIVLLMYTLKKIPLKLQFISLFIYSLPMSLFQISSYSKDAYHISLGMFVFNQLLSFFYNKKTDSKDIVLFVIALLFFILTRPQYLPFILLLILVPIKRKFHLSKRLNKLLKFTFIVWTVIILFALLKFMLTQNVYMTPYNTNTQLPYAYEINPTLQLEFLKSHPFDFFNATILTCVTQAIYYFKGTVGILGWLQTPFPSFIYLLYLLYGSIIFIQVTLSEELKVLVKRRKITVFSIVLLGVLGALFLSMYLYATPVGLPIIYGMQGRYFIMLLPLMMLLSTGTAHILMRRMMNTKKANV